MSRTAAILLAAGRSRRMAGSVSDKILAPLAGRPVFAHSVQTFMESGIADFYVIVYRDQAQLLQLSNCAPTPAVFVRGGKERQDSVAAALAELPETVDTVFIHDCARPLVRVEQLQELFRIVRRDGAVVLAHKVVDTIKEKHASRLKTIDRSKLWAMETPQVFSRELICKAYAKVQERELEITDDAQAVELMGKPVTLLENLFPNPKITKPSDLGLLEFLHRQQ